MKLPIPSFGKKNKQKYLLALLLRDEKISAIITEEVEGKMRIVGQHEELLTTPLEKLSPEEWLDTLDKTISRAEETLPPDRETHDTVFGVKESWVEEKKIKKEYLLKLKKISEALDLSPIGFLVLNEAITNLIHDEEGAPVSAILVDMGTQAVTTTLVRGGKIIESMTVPMGASLPETVDAALKHFTVEVFPSRLILFSGNSPTGETEKNEQLAQKFISHHWSKSLPFMHAPQISLLAAGFDAKAVVQGAASQMGFEVLNLTESSKDGIKTFDHDNTEVKEETQGTDETKGSKETDGTEGAKGEGTQETKGTEDKDEDNPDANIVAPSEEFGFVMEEDISKDGPPPVRDAHEKPRHHTEVTHHDADQEENLTDEGLEEPEKEGKSSPLAALTALIPAISFSRLREKLPLDKDRLTALTSGSKNKFILIPVVILVLLGALYFLYTSNLKAEITLFLKPNNVSESTDVLFSTESSNDFSEGVIHAKTVSVELDGSVSGAVTGKKETGEKAKGTVTIFNNDDSKRQLASGTTITTEKGLKYTLDKEVSVASAAGDIFSGTKPGTAQVAVTAAEFGSDYNLPSGTKFNVSGGSNIAAKNDSAFSGGTKKEITVVSKKDQDKLLTELSKSLEGKAKEELTKKAAGEQKLLPFLTQAAVTEKQFDRKVDQEAKNLKLNGTVSYEALVYTEKDIKDFAEVSLKNKYNENLNLSEKGVSYGIKSEKQKGEGEVSAQITIEAGLVPKLDKNSLITQVSGKSVSEAEEVLNKLPQVAKSEIKLSPSIPFIPVFLPKNESRITLRTALDE